jgi:protein-S-isoprenylcysteine O-methyltransferase Ste14
MNAGRIILLIVLFFAWYVLSAVELPPAALLAVALAGLPAILLSAELGRRALDRLPTPENALRVTVRTHDALILLLGSTVIAAVRLFDRFPGWSIPVPDGVGLALVILAGLLLLASTANLILSGLGIPAAYLPTRRLAADWLYGWTRNPIVLSGILFLFCLGIWIHSAWLVAWTLVLFTPTAIFLLQRFEERELEIRFGAGYLAYKSRVPMLIPRIPARPSSGNNKIDLQD